MITVNLFMFFHAVPQTNEHVVIGPYCVMVQMNNLISCLLCFLSTDELSVTLIE